MAISPAIPGLPSLPRVGAWSLLSGLTLAYFLTVTSLLTVAILWGRPGGDLLVVGLGWPHVILGLLFSLSKVIRNEGQQRKHFFSLLALSMAIGVFHTFSPITTLIYVYFVFHAFRDEILLFHQRRTGYKYAGGAFDTGGLALLAAVVLISLGGQPGARKLFGALPWDGYPHAFELGLTGATLIMALLAMRGIPAGLLEKFPGSSYALPAVFLFVAAMTGMKIGRHYQFPLPLFFALLVVFHYFSWYVFYFEKLRARPAPARPTAAPPADAFHRMLRWMTTVQGFTITVVVLNVLSFGAAYVYQVQQAAPWLAYGFDLRYFLYILVFHVTMSFMPKGPAPAAARRE